MPTSVEYTEQAAPLPATPPTTLVPSGQPAGTTAPTDPGTTSTGAGMGQPVAPAGQPMAGAAGTGAPMTLPGAGGALAPMATGGTTGMMAGTGGMSAPPTGAVATKLTASITTVTQGGKYAPKNVGAIWVADSSGKWLYTLEYWNSLVNSQWLTKYSSVNGPAYVPLFGATPPADTVTGATLNMHKTHSVSWSLKDSSGKVVPDGAYKLVIELTEASSTGKTQEYDFMKGPAASTTPADTAYFTGVKIDLK